MFKPRSCKRQPVKGKTQQHGQALLLGLVFLIGGTAALFFLFNTGQLTQEKTKLVNTADAVAYSAGVLQARALNFDAYNNRALIANEVQMAQMVSLASWAQYVGEHADKVPQVFPECYSYYGAAAAAALKFGPLYGLMCYATVNYISEYGKDIKDMASDVLAPTVVLIEASKAGIKASQALLHAPQYFQQARATLMQEVADANYVNDGEVVVEPVNALTPSGLTDHWTGFLKHYTGTERGRMAEVVRSAAATDDFTRSRSWDATAVFYEPSCMTIGVLRQNAVRRRGGTELTGFDEWIAADTESYHQNYLHIPRFGFPSCRQSETPIGYGGQQAHPSDADQDDSGAWLGGSAATNPAAHAEVSSKQWNGYTGLPSHYDLSELGQDPRLQLSVRVTRARNQLRTSDGSSQIQAPPNSRVNAYQSTVAQDVMAAVATSEVFFERPAAFNTNPFGESQGRPRELGSLFNPYWQTRLVHSAVDITQQRARQLQGGAP